FALQPSNITILWLPIGVGVILVGTLGWMALPLVAVVAFASNWEGMAHANLVGQIVHVGVAAIADTLAVAMVVLGLRRFLPRGLHSVADLARLVLVVALPAVTLSSLLLCLNLDWGGYLSASKAAALSGTLITADTLGLLLLVPCWSYWREGQRLKLSQIPVLVGALTLMVLLVAVAFLAEPAAIYLVLFLLVVVALRGSPLLLQGLLMPSVIAIVAMAAKVGLGPFAIGSQSSSVRMLVTFLLSTGLLTIGASLQRREVQREFESGQQWLHQASTDPLTGLANRRAFDDQLQRELQRLHRQGLPLSLAMIDIDHFKTINDQYGHASGDAVLKALAVLMRESVREIDLPARYGGEEFALLLIGVNSGEAWHCLERLRHRLELLQPQRIRVTLSAGLVQAQVDDTPETLLSRADALLYDAKRAGRNCVRRA
ncbi:MAG: diguanylate cyclase, partial [Cyanobium sp.]